MTVAFNLESSKCSLSVKNVNFERKGTIGSVLGSTGLFYQSSDLGKWRVVRREIADVRRRNMGHNGTSTNKKLKDFR